MSLPWIETRAFRDKVVLITGAGQGIGAGLAENFGKAGASVLACDVVAERVQETAAKLQEQGLRVESSVADITRLDQVEKLFDRCLEQFGRLDILISSAGFSERRPLLEIDEPYWDQIQGVNLKGPFFCLQRAAREMISQGEGGRIILLTSIGAYAAQMHLTAYCAAKSGLVLVTKAAAVELAGHGITVNAVGPGAVEGPWNDKFFRDPEYSRRWKATAPMRRMATNQDITGAVFYLASPDSSYVTGQVLYVDGGKLAYVPSVDVLGEALDRSEKD